LAVILVFVSPQLFVAVEIVVALASVIRHENVETYFFGHKGAFAFGEQILLGDDIWYFGAPLQLGNLFCGFDRENGLAIGGRIRFENLLGQ